MDALAHELEAVRLATRRRHPPVRATVLPALSDGDVRGRLEARAVEEMAWWMDLDSGGGEP